MKEYLKQALSSDQSVSLMRILVTFVVVDIMIVWNISCVKAMNLNDIPWGVVSVLGMVITGKAVQRFGEKQISKGED